MTYAIIGVIYYVIITSLYLIYWILADFAFNNPEKYISQKIKYMKFGYTQSTASWNLTKHDDLILHCFLCFVSSIIWPIGLLFITLFVFFLFAKSKIHKLLNKIDNLYDNT